VRSKWNASAAWCRSSTYEFATSARSPRLRSSEEIRDAAQTGLRAGDTIDSVATFAAPGVGQTIVQIITHDDNDSRAYIVDEDGTVQLTQDFWRHEREVQVERFGRMVPKLYEQQRNLAPTDRMDVVVFVYADLPEPQLPYDGTGKNVPIEEFKEWTRAHSIAQQARIAAAKSRIRSLLQTNGATILQDPRGLPTLEANIPIELLRSAELNASDVVRIDPATRNVPELFSYAGRSSMASSESSGGLSGGQCGGPCDGGSIDVGLWESSETETTGHSGLARNNTRISTNNRVTGYLFCPKTCASDADCPSLGALVRRCQAPSVGAPKVCVQDHLTWVAASVGMFGSYDYNTGIPGPGADPIPNVPSGTTFAATGAWKVDWRIGNQDIGTPGLDYLIAPPCCGQAGCPDCTSCEVTNSPPSLYINRSQGDIGDPHAINFPGRAFGTFITAAAGNINSSVVACSQLKNGLCVGAYDYLTFNDQATHRRTFASDTFSSSFLNDAGDTTLERPHLLGPGNHSSSTSGLHMPSIDVSPPSSQMRFAGYSIEPIAGTSFATPSVLSAAIQAHQFAGWFSNLAFPQVNKAVLLASTRDANNDGAIGKATVWSQNAPSVDAEDGAGQIRLDRVATIITNNQYREWDLADSDLVSCGTNCRKYTVTTLTIPANTKMRIALAWQSCMIAENSTPTLNNDLDLALNCGSPLQQCGGTTISNTRTSELEMIERPGCTFSRSCSVEVRIKNGVSVQPCGSTTTERFGIAWSFNN